MDQFRVVELLGQASGAEVGDVFREFLRSHVRLMITEVMAAEVTELCGAKYGPRAGSEYQRAGSAEGKVLLEGRGGPCFFTLSQISLSCCIASIPI